VERPAVPLVALFANAAAAASSGRVKLLAAGCLTAVIMLLSACTSHDAESVDTATSTASVPNQVKGTHVLRWHGPQF
jgi:hypothetical protein